MSEPDEPRVTRIDGIVVNRGASVYGSALAAGAGAHAEYHGGSAQLDTVERHLEQIRELLTEAVAAGPAHGDPAGGSATDDGAAGGGLTPGQRAAVAEAVDGAEQELVAARSGSGLSRLTERLGLLAACLTSTGTLAQAGERLYRIIATLVG